MPRTIAIGDIHGCAIALAKLSSGCGATASISHAATVVALYPLAVVLPFPFVVLAGPVILLRQWRGVQFRPGVSRWFHSWRCPVS